MDPVTNFVKTNVATAPSPATTGTTLVVAEQLGCRWAGCDFSHEYNLASTRKEDFIFDLVKRLKDKS